MNVTGDILTTGSQEALFWMRHPSLLVVLACVMLGMPKQGSGADPLVQRWFNLYDQGAADTDEAANKLVVDAAGNAIVAGTSNSNRTGQDIVVHKYNRNTGSLLWEARYNGPGSGTDFPNDVALDAGGNVIVTGQSQGSGTGIDYWTAKYAAASGSLIWEVRYNGPGNDADSPLAVAVDATGNVIVTGQSVGTGTNRDYYTAKYSAANGALIWEKRYNGPANGADGAIDVAVDAAGNVIVTGEARFVSTNADYHTIKYAASNGAVLWEKRYNNSNFFDYARGMAVDGEGNVIVTGYSYSGTSAADYYTVKYAAADGAEVWSVRYTSPDSFNDLAVGVAVDAAGNAVVTGSSFELATQNNGYTAKYAAADGALLWEKRYNNPGSSYDTVSGLALDGSGNVLITGSSETTGGPKFMFVAKYNAGNGSLAWEKRFSAPSTQDGSARGRSVAADINGNVIVTGELNFSSANGDFYTAKHAGINGSLLWETRQGKIGPGQDLGRAVVMDGAGNVVVAGNSQGAGTDQDFYTAKYAANTGSLIWAARYNGPANDEDTAQDVAVDAEGNVIVTGASSNGANDDICTVKYAAATGSLLWERRYNGPGNLQDSGVAVAVDGSGNVIVTGGSVNAAGNGDFYTAKYARADGTLLWERRYDGPDNNFDSPVAVKVDANGDVVVTGSSRGTGSVFDFYTAKYAAVDGALVWESRYNGTGNNSDTPAALVLDSAGNAIVTGSSLGPSSNPDYATVKYAAADGSQIWLRRYNGPATSDYPNALAVDSVGDVYVTGYSNTNSSNPDVYTAKYGAATGAILWEKRYDSPGTNLWDFGEDVKVDDNGNVVVTGSSGLDANYSSSKIHTLVYASANGDVLKEASFNNPIGAYCNPTAMAVGLGGVIAVTGSANFGPAGDNDLLTVLYGLNDLAIPEIAVSGNATNIANGDNTPRLEDHTDFGAAQVTLGSVVRTFTVANTGTGPLDLSGSPRVQRGGPHATDFVVTMQPASPVAAQTATTFTVTFTPSGSGLRTANLSFLNDDADETPFTFAVQGRGTVLPPATVLLSNLTQAPDGNPKPVTVTTVPPGLNVQVTYNSSSTPPTALGTYTVVAEVDEAGYEGEATGTLVLDHRADRPVVQPPGWENGLPATSDVGVWMPSAPGLYDGLLRDQADGVTLVGALENLKVSKAARNAPGGAASGVVRLRGQTATFRGVFSAAGALSVDTRLRGGVVVEVRLGLRRVLPGGDDVVSGTVTWKKPGSADVVALAYLPRAAGLAPVKRQGKFTVLLPSQPGWGVDQPGGDGWGAVTIARTGVVMVKGKLGDGTAFTETAHLSAQGEFSLFRDLYRSVPEKGRIGGRARFRDLPGVSDFDGRMQWVKFGDARERQYVGGFTEEVVILGCRFTSYPAGIRLLGALEDADPNAVFNLIGPSLPPTRGEEVERVLSWLVNNRLVHFGPEKLSGNANRATGLVSSSFFDPVSRLRVAAQGVVFQKQELAAGQFVLGAASGAVRLFPGTSFPYPGGESAGASLLADAPAMPAAPPALDDSMLDPAAAGTYEGVLGDSGGVTGALENVQVSATGAISGVLWLDGVKRTFRSQLIGGPPAAATIDVGGVLLTLLLKKESAPQAGYQLAGTVVNGAVSHTLAAQRLPGYSGGQQAPQEGAYTLAILAPDSVNPVVEPGGDGYATLKVSRTGACTGALVLAEGARTTFGGHVTAFGEWSFYRTLYGSNPARGYVGGKLTFRNDVLSDVDGLWRWVKLNTAVTRPAVYTAGIGVTRRVVGAKWTPPARGVRAWSGLANDWFNVWCRWKGPSLSGLTALLDLDRVATWNTANRVLHFGPDSLMIAVNSSSGLVSGTYRNAGLAVNQGFGGVLLQKQGLITGSYVNERGSGRFWMQPRP